MSVKDLIDYLNSLPETYKNYEVQSLLFIGDECYSTLETEDIEISDGIVYI